MKIKDRVVYFIYRLLLGVLALLPMAVLYGIGAAMRLLLQHVVKYRRKVIRQNLHMCFPEKSESDFRQIEDDFYRQFTDNIVETIKLLHMSDRLVDRLVEIHGAQLVDQAAAEGRSVILYLGHYANWELVPSIVRQFHNPLICAQVYKPLHDQAFNRLMLKIRNRFRPMSLPQKKVFRQLITWHRAGQPFICGFIADQRGNSGDNQRRTLFMGQQTDFNPGGEEVGQRINATYLYLDITKPLRHRYVLTFKPIEPVDMAVDHPYTRRYFEMLEATIRRRPGLWLWSHRRWLFTQS